MLMNVYHSLNDLSKNVLNNLFFLSKDVRMIKYEFAESFAVYILHYYEQRKLVLVFKDVI
jgi:hypothetical protein